MKNNYSKFIKYIEKQDRVFIQCKNEHVYITDGKIVIKTPLYYYSMLIKPLSGILPDIQEDCTGVKNTLDNIIKIDNAHGFDIAGAVENIKNNYTLKMSDFLMILPTTGKKKKQKQIRIFLNDNNIIPVDNMYIEMIDGCEPFSNWCSSGKNKDPIVKQNDDFSIIIFPVKVNPDYFEILQNIRYEG